MATDFPPDGFDVYGTGVTWTTDIDFTASGSALTGDGYWNWLSTTPAGNPGVIWNTPIPIEGGSPYSIYAPVYVSSIAAGNKMRIGVNWLDEDEVKIGATIYAFDAILAAINTWENRGGTLNAPATARFAQPVCEKVNTAFTARMDRLDFWEMPFAFSAFLSSDQSVTPGADLYEFDSELYDFGSWYNTATFKATVPANGIYTFQAQAQIELLDTDEFFLMEIGTNAAASRVAFSPNIHSWADDTDITNQVVVTKFFVKGEEIHVGGFHGHGANLNISGEATGQLTWFSGQRVE